MNEPNIKIGKPMKLPTSLVCFDYYHVSSDRNGPSTIIGAVPLEKETSKVPSILKWTDGHGNLCSHANPVVTTPDAKTVDATFLKDGYSVHVNDGYRAVTNWSDNPTDITRGTKHCQYRYADGHGNLVYVTNHLAWYKYNTGLYNYTMYYSTNVVEPCGVINKRIATKKHQWRFDESRAMTASLPKFDHWAERVGSYTCTKGTTYTAKPIHITWDLPWKSPTLFFRHKEYNFLWNFGEKDKFVEDMQTLAFQSAFTQVPAYADNNIANMLEMGSMVMDALHPDSWPNVVSKLANKVRGLRSSSKEVAKAVGSLWLAYRYAYSTTKSDTQQALDYLGRKAITYYTSQSFNGIASAQSPYTNSEVICRVKFDIRLNAADMLGMLHHYGQVAGVNISAYKLWDLVPFSFVVDWFFDIGGVLEDQEMLGNYSDYLFSNFWWSLAYRSNAVEPYTMDLYTRWNEKFVPNRVIHEYNASGGKTWLKRIGDSVALVSGALS